MAEYRVYPLTYGWIERDKGRFTFRKDDGKRVLLPIMGYYLTNGIHRIVIDTGGFEPDGLRLAPYHRAADETPEGQLAKIGVEADSIDTVILTHLHWDHSCNNESFQNARFYVQAKEMAFALDPPPEQKNIYFPEIFLKTRYELVDGDIDLFEDLKLILTPGHSLGSQSVVVSDAKGPIAIVGDTLPLQENWNSRPRIPCGSHASLELACDSIEKIAGYTDRILTGHEWLRE